MGFERGNFVMQFVESTGFSATVIRSFWPGSPPCHTIPNVAEIQSLNLHCCIPLVSVNGIVRAVPHFVKMSVLSVFAIQVVLVKMGSCSVLALLSLHTNPFLTGVTSSLSLFFYLYVCWLDLVYLLRYFVLHFFYNFIWQNKTEIQTVSPGRLTVIFSTAFAFVKGN